MNVRPLITTLLLIAAGTAAEASSLRLVPSAGTVMQGSTFTVNLVLNATDAPGPHPSLFGGEVIVDFDKTLLAYGGFTLASGLSYFPTNGGPVVTTSGDNQKVQFGFDNAVDLGTVGTFSFLAIGSPGSLALIGLQDADDFSGSFANYTPTYLRFDPTFVRTQLNITAVPLPAGVWLLGTAVGALAARRRFRHATA